MDLDNQQKQAVETQSKKALVISGAGSGKTRVLTHRVQYLLETQKVSAFEVMAFSFTRKSSQELRGRLEKLIDTQAYKCTLGTMHGIALTMIQRFGETIGLKAKNVTVYSEWETQYLLCAVAIGDSKLKITIDKKGREKKTWKIPKKQIDKMFADYYERGIKPDPDHKAYSIFIKFFAQCRANNSLTYGLLLITLEKLIPELSKHLHIKHILVDEVQDIDPLQWRIITYLCETFNASLFVVGDIDQSIFSFRGAVPGYLIEHQNEFDIFKIEKNYRSDGAIVEAANNLIQHNSDRLEKTMVPNNPATLPIVCIKDTDSAGIVSLLKGFVGKDVCVLGRRHVFLNKMSKLLGEQGIKHVYVGKENALTRSEEFRRFHAFLKLIVNPFDNFAFLLIRDLIGLNQGEYEDIEVGAAHEGKSHFQVWIESTKLSQELQAVFYMVDSNGDQRNVDAAFISLINLDWPFDITDIVDFVFKWSDENPASSPEAYLSWLATYDLQDEIKEEATGIQLMTVHSAKGLEFPTVIIAGCNEGILPSSQAIKTDNIEDERRLFYVAITRAEKQLINTIRPESSEYNGKLKLSPVSRFIRESQTKKENSKNGILGKSDTGS